MKPNSNWGTAGFADAGHWPFLPLGMMTAGNPIPGDDLRQISLVAGSIGPPRDGIPDVVDVLARAEGNPSGDGGTILDDIPFIISLDEKPEWSAYEKRRMRKIVRRLSRASEGQT